ncbi:MAG: nitrophenyl compound nitroreductase subunit ArsF family protein [Alistipes sp.]
MKRYLSVVVMFLFALSATAQTKADGRVEVIYFHGKQRCATCMAIEKHAREVVEQDCAEAKADGRLTFKVVDITTAEGTKLAKEYRVTWSSLYINGIANGTTTRNNLTQFAFKNARNNTDEFKKGIKCKIDELLR